MQSAIIGSLDLKDYLEKVSAGVSEITKAFATLIEARKALCELGLSEYHFNRALSPPSREALSLLTNQNWLQVSIENIHAEMWDLMLIKSGLRSFMDQEARAEWDATIRGKKTPEFSEQNVRDLFLSIYGERNTLLRRGVVNVFRRLNHKYATNSVWSLGKKVILNNAFSRPPWQTLSHEVFDKIDDLVRVFCMLDGQPEPDHTRRTYMLLSESEDKSCLDTDYLYITLHRTSRTAHVNFKRLDLLERVNAMLAAEFHSALPDASTAKRDKSKARAGTVAWA